MWYFRHREGCQRYDIVFIARRECFDDVFDFVKQSCVQHARPPIPIVFDTVDLHFMREDRVNDFVREHANDLSLIRAVFGTKFDSARVRQENYEVRPRACCRAGTGDRR